MTERIYIQIPAYRDRELLPTLENLMQTAREPARLRIAVAWQYGAEEAALEPRLRRWPNVHITKIPAHASRGCNWARALLQRQWAGEPYTLFLDSHHRFIDGWDEATIEAFEELRRDRSQKPILTAYLPPYDPHDDPRGRTQCIYAISPHERHEGLLFRLTGHAVRDWKLLERAIPAKFVSLHFLFADGSFNEQVPFDSSIYFFADEVAVALRAYTSGYDLFHPHAILGWHLYDRSTRVTHWNDHADWGTRNRRSVQRLSALYRGALRGRYGVGQTRSIADFEALMGESLMTG